MNTVQKYWDEKFKDKGQIWGDEPSEAAIITESFLSNRGFNEGRILDIACGYGRDSKHFNDKGFDVTGIDISVEGISMAKSQYSNVEFMVGDILHLPFPNESFNVIFGNFILHLFIKEQRSSIIKEALRVIKPGGIAAFSVASSKDPDYGQGESREPNCFVNARGVTKYYYSENDILYEFKDFEIISIHDIEEYHEHDGIHIHKSYLLFARKR